MDAFPKAMLPSEIVGLVEKVLSDFLWPMLGKTSNSILIMVPSGPAVDGLRSGVGRQTRTVSSNVQGFKTWFSSSVQPNRVLLKVFRGEPPRHEHVPKSWGLRAEPTTGSRNLRTAGRVFWGAARFPAGRHVPAMTMSSPEPPGPLPLPAPCTPIPQRGRPPARRSGGSLPARCPRCQAALSPHGGFLSVRESCASPLSCAQQPFAVTLRYLLDEK